MTLEHTLRQRSENLLKLPGLPESLKQDITELLHSSAQRSLPETEHAGRLIDIYDQATKLFIPMLEPSSSTTDTPLFHQLVNQLQTLITELDFDGEAGHTLRDIRTRLLMDISANTLVELTLTTLELVIRATQHERKSSEYFLNQVNQYLSQLLKGEQEIIDNRHNDLDNRNDIHHALQTVITQTDEKIQAATKLDELKADMVQINGKLSDLTERLIQAEQREKNAIQTLTHQQKQLASLHASTHDYHRRLTLQAKKHRQDPLTKLYNRHTLNALLRQEHAKWQQDQTPLRVILFDIDKFNRINLDFGFTAGDKALRIIAHTLAKEFADIGITTRFAGEKFVTIVTTSDPTLHQQRIQEVQEKIRLLPFKFKHQNITITVSATSCAFNGEDRPDDVLQRASAQMAVIKATGPGQISWEA